MRTRVANNDNLLEIEVNVTFHHNLNLEWDDELENNLSEVYKKAADNYIRRKTPRLRGKCFLILRKQKIQIIFLF